MDYSALDDGKITKEIIRLFTKIIETDDKDYWGVMEGFSPDDISAEIFRTPDNFSSRSKLEYYFAKCELLDFLKYSRLASITNPKWAEYNWEKMTFLYEWGDDLDKRVASFKELYGTLQRRTDLSIKRKRAQNNPDKKKPSSEKKRAASANGTISGDYRHYRSLEAAEKVLYRAWELFESGTPKHNVVSILDKQFPISARQIRRYLWTGFRGWQLHHIERDNTGRIEDVFLKIHDGSPASLRGLIFGEYE